MHSHSLPIIKNKALIVFGMPVNLHDRMQAAMATSLSEQPMAL